MGRIEQPAKARIRELKRVEIETILGRNHVGRLAFSFQDRVDIRPIHYVYRNSSIYGYTSEGTKIEAIAHNMWVAFEVDEVRATFDWRSVIVRGGFYVISSTGTRYPDPADTAVQEDFEYSQALAALRLFLPDAMTASDPTPFRRIVFRIQLDEATGRECTPDAIPPTPT